MHVNECCIHFCTEQVVVLDSSNSPQEENLDQMLIKAECDINTEANVSLPTKRATILWEKTLEDVMEDDGEEEEQLERANSGLHEINLVATNVYPKDTKPEMKEETPSQSRGCDEDEDDGDLVIGKTEYQVFFYARQRNPCICGSENAKCFKITFGCSGLPHSMTDKVAGNVCSPL